MASMTLVLSLIHPVLMLMLSILWAFAFVLGWRARQERLSKQPHASDTEQTPLMPNPTSARERKHHHKLASALACLTISGAVGGIITNLVTDGRVYPGPHLYTAFAIVIAVSFNVALVPWFKDLPRVRVVHIFVGFCVLVMFASQILTGIPILTYLF